jgi:hypothetical protein
VGGADPEPIPSVTSTRSEIRFDVFHGVCHTICVREELLDSRREIGEGGVPNRDPAFRLLGKLASCLVGDSEEPVASAYQPIQHAVKVANATREAILDISRTAANCYACHRE